MCLRAFGVLWGCTWIPETRFRFLPAGIRHGGSQLADNPGFAGSFPERGAEPILGIRVDLWLM